MKAKYLLLLLPLLATLAFAQEAGPVTGGIGGQGAMIFEAGGSARSLAMGQAFTAIGDRGEAVLYNPAGLGQIHSARLSLMGGSLYAGSFQSVLAYNMPWATFGTFGLAYVGAFGALEETVGPNGQNIDANGSMNSSGVLISYAKKFGAFGLGIAPKLMYGQLAGEQAIGFDLDAGMMFYPNSFGIIRALPYDLFTIGVAGKNLMGSTMSYSDSEMEPANPRIVRAGLGIRLLDNRVKIGSDISYSLDSNQVFGFYEGLEIYPAKMFAVRFGANSNYFTAGAGINTELSRNMGLEVDYAFLYHYGADPGMLQPVHKVSVNLELKSVAGLWLSTVPASLTSPAEYAEITVNGAAQYKGRTKRWVFEIKDQAGNVRYRVSRDVYGSMDEIPPKFTWNGVDNIRGGQVDSGNYYYQFTIFDKLGDEIVFEGLLLKIDWKGGRR